MYCTKQCFKEDWKRHCATHQLGGGGTAPYSKDSTPRKAAHLNGKGNRGDSVGDDDTSSSTTNGGSGGSSPDEHWDHVGSDMSYVPSEEDVGCVLMISVTAVSQANDTVIYGPMVIYTEPVLAAPVLTTKRVMVPVQLQPGQQPVSPGTIKFRILSYNVLAELYATKQAYPYADSWLLSWPYRRALIMQELEHMQGDIVCLQEVQMDHFEMHLSPFMHEMGFDGLFKSKSRESMGQYGKVDGCATFWKLAKFSMTEHYTIEFNDLARHAISDMGLDQQEERK
jgi:CCR4-NOT transcription complex subunit 6